ncbi:MAG: glycosyltransferase [Collinsella sp.]
MAAASEGKGIARVVYWPGEFNYSQIINFGVKHAKGDYLLLLNNDTEVISPDFIEEMMGYLQRPDAGVVGAKLYFADHLVQHAGILIGVRGALAHANQDFSAKREGYLARAVRPGNFSAVTGACQMVRRDVFERVGGYNEEFAVGFNDADFCLRVGRRVTAPSLRPMPSCTTTSSPRAAGKRPTRKAAPLEA